MSSLITSKYQHWLHSAKTFIIQCSRTVITTSMGKGIYYYYVEVDLGICLVTHMRSEVLMAVSMKVLSSEIWYCVLNVLTFWRNTGNLLQHHAASYTRRLNSLFSHQVFIHGLDYLMSRQVLINVTVYSKLKHIHHINLISWHAFLNCILNFINMAFSTRKLSSKDINIV